MIKRLQQKAGECLSLRLPTALIFFVVGTNTEFAWVHTYDVNARVSIVGSFSEWKEVRHTQALTHSLTHSTPHTLTTLLLFCTVSITGVMRAVVVSYCCYGYRC